ncbi:restriction endonuclease [Salinibacter ruber]|jgi:restriction system protein|uniref:restriction endonuclease n=1 Tax=Salinibacter ruber TaxID=146919 RepID=UPI002169C7FD|nr:restriction endonuclease [Salinibacter ruber]MCS4201714.1 restriction system protein [Salinibacter ruber]
MPEDNSFSKSDVPSHKELFNPLIRALHELGGSGTIDEITEEVIDLEDIPDGVANVLHSEGGSRTELEYRLAWARTYLKKYGLLDNPSRGVWVIQSGKSETTEVDPDAVAREVRKQDRQQEADSAEATDSQEVDSWQDRLHRVLTEKLEPEAFERLTQRMLRQSGFVEVEVTQRSSDGGIDGTGIIQLNGLLSFHVVFQCKRYQGSVSVGEIRDFRGAMVGRADKGLFITTGTFTREAKEEAKRDGATPIDLIDGEDFMEKLRDLELGVETEMVEKVSIDRKWLQSI